MDGGGGGGGALPFQGPKKSFQGPPLPMALVMDVACIKIITSRDIYTTGTFIDIYNTALYPCLF
jgi:hypothetical protein